MSGVCEVDGTSLRTIRVYKQTTRFAKQVAEWRARYPRRAEPRYWLLHVRLLGAVQRSDSRKLCIFPAEYKLTQPKAVPPTESTQEIVNSKLLTKVKRNATLMADGNGAWSAAARSYPAKCFVVKHVKHSKAEFVKKAVGQKSFGTQTLDRCWDVLKRAVPTEVGSRRKDAASDTFRVLTYVYAATWRRQLADANLLEELGSLCRRA